MSIKSRLADYKQARAERKGYRRIVAKKTTLAARQAYADEAVKVARERARMKARQPGVLASIGSFALRGAERISRPKARASPVRRVARRRVARRTTRVSYARKRRSYAPARRTVRRRVVRRAAAPAQPRGPMSLNDAIYGGY